MILWVSTLCNLGDGYEYFDATGCWKQEVKRLKHICKRGKII
jgi:hypothetical protein